jgi:pSer/pThr/pTyr-binding forkhead associated (FHA) protein
MNPIKGLTCERIQCKNRAMRRLPILVITDGVLKGTRLPIPDEGVVVGRDEGCDITLPDQGVSREHCRVLLHNSGVWVRDLGSRNGVFLKGKRVNRPKQIMPGDVLKVGDHLFTVELGPLVSGEESVSTIPLGVPNIVQEEAAQLTSSTRSPVKLVVAVLALLLVAAGLAMWLD